MPSQLQRLQPLWDPTFSEHSYGFRPGRSAHQAVTQAQAYVAQGHRIVVDFDLAKFFDRVNHDRLMAAVAVRVSDRRVLSTHCWPRCAASAGVSQDHFQLPLLDLRHEAAAPPQR